MERNGKGNKLDQAPQNPHCCTHRVSERNRRNLMRYAVMNSKL